MADSAAAAPAPVPAPAAAPPSDALKEKVKKQLEFYFSDANFRRDKFLREKANSDPDGYVPITVLLTFNRLKALTTGAWRRGGDSVEGAATHAAGRRRRRVRAARHAHPPAQLPRTLPHTRGAPPSPAPCSRSPPPPADPAVIAASLQDSVDLEVAGDNNAVRRTHPLPSEDDSDTRCVYAKGPFPSDSTLDALQSFFAGFGAVKHLQMRRTRGKGEHTFKGSVFVEFATKAEADGFLAAWKGDAKPAYGGVPLVNVETKTAYVTRKKAEILERRAKKMADKTTTKAAAVGARAAKGGAEGAAKAEGGEDAGEAASSSSSSSSAAAAEGGAPKAGEKRAFDRTVTPGVLVKVAGLGPAATRDALTAYLNGLGDGVQAKYVDMDLANASAIVRFTVRGAVWEGARVGRGGAAASERMGRLPLGRICLTPFPSCRRPSPFNPPAVGGGRH
jgi:hypothetical protein